ncbi:phage tail protein [Halomonas sp. HK25]|uniref:phage tail protein n=1 Tax=Halomonas sp. HK25 TaxID=3394321 RepID=UPI0039FD2128
MKKLTSLRAYLLERIPDLKRNPDRLLTFIEDGRIEFHRGAHLSHEYRVPVRIVLTDHSGELDTVMIPLLQWLSRYQPDLDPTEAVSFQAELLHNRAWDLAIDVTLTERVVALVDCDAGTIHVDHRMPEFPLDPCAADDWQLYIRDAEAEDGYTLEAEWQQ